MDSFPDTIVPSNVLKLYNERMSFKTRRMKEKITNSLLSVSQWPLIVDLFGEDLPLISKVSEELACFGYKNEIKSHISGHPDQQDKLEIVIYHPEDKT